MTKSQLFMRPAGLGQSVCASIAFVLLMLTGTANAGIDGVAGSNFNLTASEGYVSIADGASVYSWGYSTNGTMQLPGPTLIVTSGDTITVTLDNSLPAAAGNVSIVFPGHSVSTTGGVQGALTQEATPGGEVEYTFTAGAPGTYTYHSGTRPELQVEMGLYGALIVRPAVTPAACLAGAGYADALLRGALANNIDTCFDREYLFLLSEIDMQVHQAAEDQRSAPGPIDIGTGSFTSEYWLINGRTAPDTMAPAGNAILPHQPYNIVPRMHPGERVLLRIVGAGREMHPFHTHGNHVRVLARDGRLLTNSGGALSGPLLFTVPSLPGGTVDAVFEWTGEGLGWDIYGHTESTPPSLEPNEYAPDHGKPIPVELPDLSSLTFGGFYSGSPYLGALGSLPPGEGGLNPNAGFTYMWHSHNERELVNNDVFPGGMMTMMIIEAPAVEIDE